MLIQWMHKLWLVATFLFIQVHYTSAMTKPACHTGMMKLFHWCEQSNCKNNCTCLSATHVCKQLCGQKSCGLLFCSSPQTCFQRVIANERVAVPKVKELISHSPITQQDCSEGNCKYMKALRYKENQSRSFQSCSERSCEHVYANTDHAKQFCRNCDKMTCTGKYAKNCTQICVLGNCKQMICNARHCKQLCSHESTCNLTCGENTVTCDQTCSHGSKCIMNCKGKECSQVCKVDNKKDCVLKDLRTFTTTSEPTTQTTTMSITTTEMTNVVENINEGNGKEVENDVDNLKLKPSKSSSVVILTFWQLNLFLCSLLVLLQ